MPTKSELWANPEWCRRHWGKRRGRPWSDAEYDKAITMRLFKRKPDEIAAELGRSKRSVFGKIGYWRAA